MYANTFLCVHQRLEAFCLRPNVYLDINEMDSGNNSLEMDPVRNAATLFRNFTVWGLTVPATPGNLHLPRRRQWHPTPVFLPGESQGQRSLVGCRLWGRTELDTTEAT